MHRHEGLRIDRYLESGVAAVWLALAMGCGTGPGALSSSNGTTSTQTQTPDSAPTTIPSPAATPVVVDPAVPPSENGATDAGTGSAGASFFTVGVIPDTQYYIDGEGTTDMFKPQTKWFADNRASENIVFVSHVGDVVESGANASEWKTGVAIMDTLKGTAGGWDIPYAVAPGNHDLQGVANFKATFGATKFAGQPWYGGAEPGKELSSYQRLDAAGVKLIFVSLRYCPTKDELSWAQSILKANLGRMAIVTTHGYLSTDGNTDFYTDEAECENTNAPADLAAFFASNENVHLVLCGHEYSDPEGESRLTQTITGSNRTVHALLSDYQGRPNGGDGYMRIMRFDVATNKVSVKTYSPYLKKYETDGKSQFELPVPLSQYR